MTRNPMGDVVAVRLNRWEPNFISGPATASNYGRHVSIMANSAGCFSFERMSGFYITYETNYFGYYSVSLATNPLLPFIKTILFDNIEGALILADYIEEQGDPRAKQLRRYWVRVRNEEAAWTFWTDRAQQRIKEFVCKWFIEKSEYGLARVCRERMKKIKAQKERRKRPVPLKPGWPLHDTEFSHE